MNSRLCESGHPRDLCSSAKDCEALEMMEQREYRELMRRTLARSEGEGDF